MKNYLEDMGVVRFPFFDLNDILMIKGIYWPENFWTIEDFKVKLDMEKHFLNVSGYLACDGDRLIDDVNSEPKGIVFSASFESIRKMASIICDKDADMSQILSDYITRNVVEGLASQIYEDYLPNVKDSTDYEGNGKDEAFLKDYCIDKLSKEQYCKVKNLNKELTKKLKEIL